jgi:hypothetical protein
VSATTATPVSVVVVVVVFLVSAIQFVSPATVEYRKQTVSFAGVSAFGKIVPALPSPMKRRCSVMIVPVRIFQKTAGSNRGWVQVPVPEVPCRLPAIAAAPTAVA